MIINSNRSMYSLETLPEAVVNECIFRQFLGFDSYLKLVEVSKKIKKLADHTKINWHARDLDVSADNMWKSWVFLKQQFNLEKPPHPSLVEKSQNYCKRQSDIINILISKLKLAKSVNFFNMTHYDIQVDEFKYDDVIQLLENSSSLLGLAVHNFYNFFNIADKLPNSLKKLSINYCTVHDNSLEIIGKKCPNLESLEIISKNLYSSISEDGLKSILEACPKLTFLKICNVDLSYESLQLISSCLNLEFYYDFNYLDFESKELLKKRWPKIYTL